MHRSHIYLIDDDRRRRDLLAEILQPHHRLHVFADAPAFLHWIDYERIPNAACVVTYLGLAPMSGVELVDVFRADRIVLPTVLIGATSELALAVKAMRYGMAYVLWQPFGAARLIEVVASVLREWQQPSTPAPADSRQTVEDRFATLSRRQRQVLRHVFEGNDNRTIAAALGISIKTVELHRACMMKKMSADSVVALVRMVSDFRSALERCA